MHLCKMESSPSENKQLSFVTEKNADFKNQLQKKYQICPPVEGNNSKFCQNIAQKKISSKHFAQKPEIQLNSNNNNKNASFTKGSRKIIENFVERSSKNA